MPIPQLFFHIVTYFMFTGSEIIAPEINQESNLNLQQDERFIIYARNYMQPCFADYVSNQAEIAGSFTVDAAPSEYENRYKLAFMSRHNVNIL